MPSCFFLFPQPTAEARHPRLLNLSMLQKGLLHADLGGTPFSFFGRVESSANHHH